MSFFPVQFGIVGLVEATAFGWATNTAPYMFLRSFNIDTGVGVGITGATPNPAGDGNAIAFSTTGGAVGLGETGLPRLIAWPFGPTGVTGAKYSDPATLPTGNPQDVNWSPVTGDFIICSHETSPYVSVYPWNDATGFGVKVANPASLPPNTVQQARWDINEAALAGGHFTTPFVIAWEWSVSGFGTKYANPGSNPGSTGGPVSFNPDDDALAVGAAIPVAYDWAVGSGFGSRYGNPPGVAGTDYPNTGVTGFQFSPTGAGIVASSISTSGGVMFGWPWDHGTGFGTRWPDPDTNQGSNAWECNFTPSARAVIFSLNPELDTQYPQLYPWTDAGGFGTRYAPPSPTVAGFGFDVSFNGRI